MRSARLGVDRKLDDPVLLLDALIAAHHVHRILSARQVEGREARGAGERTGKARRARG